MARPIDKEYRAAILGALDTKLMVSMGEVITYLKDTGHYRSYPSTRRMLLRMSAEGLIFLHPQRLDKGEMVFTKNVMSQHLVLKDMEGNVVTLSQFIASVYKLEFPPIISEEVAIAIKSWMFDYLVSADPSLFKGVREVPNKPELKKKLKGTLGMLKDLHSFIKHFLDSDIHSPVATQKLVRELGECPPKQIELLVNRDWMHESS